jgi:hypothetical protein
LRLVLPMSVGVSFDLFGARILYQGVVHWAVWSGRSYRRDCFVPGSMAARLLRRRRRKSANPD